VLWLAGSGIILGLSGAIAVSRFLQSQLYEIAPDDPLTMAGAAITLFIVALLAGYVPARRATRVNPVLALKYE
jgi:putative ABC transport system permease protein